MKLLINKQSYHLSSYVGYLLLLMISCLCLASCDNKGEEVISNSDNVMELNDANVKKVVSALAGDYSLALDDLIHAFNSHKKAGTPFDFIIFRNTKWTPEYMSKKNHYHDILEKNMAYITDKNIKPLFIKFEELIFIGLDLKHALYDGDDERLKNAVTTIEEDKKAINATLKSAGFKLQLQSLYEIPLPPELRAEHAENKTDTKTNTTQKTKDRIGD